MTSRREPPADWERMDLPLGRGPIRPLVGAVRSHRTLSILLGVLFSGALVTVFLPRLEDTVGPPTAVLAAVSASVLFISRSRRCERRERIAWTSFGLAFASASTGMLVIPISELFGYVPPAFGWPDTFFLASYALVFGGLTILPHGERSRLGRLLDTADGLVGAVSLATLSWTWFLADYVDRFDEAPTLNRVLGFAYPILDIAALIVVMMLWLRRSDVRFDRRLLVLGVGIIMQAFADITFVNSARGETFSEAEPVYALFVGAFACYLIAAAMVDKRPEKRELSDRPRARWTLVGPYGLAAVMLSTLIVSTWSNNSADARLLTVSTVLVAAIIIGRQFASIRENAIAVERQRQSLISTVSHELRTPLTSLYGLLEILSTDIDQLPAEESREFLTIATQQARYMGRVVSDLVTLTRGGDELASVKVGEADLGEIVKHAVGQAAPDGVVRITIPPARVRVDADRMTQAVSNLVTNALKYGASNVLIRGRTEGDLVLEVHDDGPGVPVKHQLSIWKQFERGAHQFDGRTPGSGIGLAIVSAVARAHGGKAGYRDSNELGGACFWLRLPNTVVRKPSRVADSAEFTPESRPAVPEPDAVVG